MACDVEDFYQTALTGLVTSRVLVLSFANRLYTTLRVLNGREREEGNKRFFGLNPGGLCNPLLIKRRDNSSSVLLKALSPYSIDLPFLAPFTCIMRMLNW